MPTHSDTALIFDIQHSSFVDGPGIRTTIFFKGCNLRCQWCHNPEGICPERQMIVYRSRCRHCGKCAKVCPTGALDQSVCPDLTFCTLCGSCVDACPADARRICGESRSLDEVLRIVGQDKVFYDTSGGGVTCSGGECLLQVDFLEEFLRRCRQTGIQTAVDTAGHVPWERFTRVLPFTDLFLYDIKAIDPDLHRRGTGAGNSLILKNYIRLIRLAPVWVRVPVIGGFNADRQSLADIRDFLKQHPPAGIDLLPYHALGEHKYGDLSLANSPCGKPSDEIMAAAREMLCI
ncbi:MAG: glycyl-radical enzyme activating protein [Bacillota bacterium]|nr:glycyl-radical enzyme activating protein [Bacillota bacterium]